MNRLLNIAAWAFILSSSVWAQVPEEEFWVYPFARGDSIYSVSQRYLRNPADWQRLQQFNKVRLDRAMPVGTPIRIPLAWLKLDEMDAEIDAVQGNAQVERGGARIAVTPGAKLRSGDRLVTGEGASLSFRMSDGSKANVQPRSNVFIDSMRALTSVDLLVRKLRVDQGRIETDVVPRKNASSRYEVGTSVAVMGVRGTRFRVTADKITSSEVLEGEVGVQGTGASRAVAVPAGFGTVVDGAGRVSPPIELLPPPMLAASIPLQERVAVRIAFNAVPRAASYRAQISSDAEFRTLVAEDVNAAPAARFSSVADGDYFLRVRAIDAHGLEGRDAVSRFRLKAQPEPPFASAPADRGTLSGLGATFSWSAAADASGYQFQLTQEAAFAKPLRDQRVAGVTLALDELAPGRYLWRLRSVRAAGASADDFGPWGDAQAFELRVPPAKPEPPALEGAEARFRWRGEPGQTFLFQLARDDKFADLVLERTLKEPEIAFPKPVPGSYFMRFRATDPDGFVGPFSTSQRVEIPSPPPPPPPEPGRPWWLLLLLLFF